MDDSRIFLLDLPDSLLLDIIGYLSVPDQLLLAETCQRFRRVVYDDILWHHNLREDKHVLYIRYEEALESVTSRADNFNDRIQTVVSDPHYASYELYNLYITKENRLKSSLPVSCVDSTSMRTKLVTFMGSFFKSRSNAEDTSTPPPPPCSSPDNAAMVTMFGPGMESVSTKNIVRKILNSRSSQLCAMATTTGNQSIRKNMVTTSASHVNFAVGGGIIVKFYDKFLQFVTLYSNIQLSREGLSHQQRLENSKLFEKDSRGQYKIKAGIQSVCETTAAFIYVIDISKEVEMSSDLFYDLHAFAEHNGEAPILVLACIKDANTVHHRWPTLLQEIKLHTYTQPWQISLIDVETLHNLDTALDWVVAHAVLQ